MKTTVTQSDLDAVAARYPNARRSGSGYKISCPVHGGEDANCYIGVGDNDGLVARCWSRGPEGGCTWKAIADALGLLPDRQAEHFQTAYEHKDGRNRNVYRRGDGKGKKVWGKGSAGAKLLLYGNGDERNTIVICEGEKAAEALLAMQFVRKTPASYRGGTGSVHLADYSACEGRDVVIWPDADEPGYKAALIAAEKAVEAGATEVRLINTEGLEEGIDAADVDKETASRLIASSTPIDLHPTPELHEEAEQERKHGGAREGAGRPLSENPSEATLANRRRNLKTRMINWSLEANLPLHLRFDEPVACTLARLTQYEKESFLIVDNAAYIPNGGVWRMLDPRDPIASNRLWQMVQSALNWAVTDLPEDAPPEYEEHLRAVSNPGRLIRDLISSVVTVSHIVTVIPSVAFNDRNAYPIIPHDNNTALDLRSGLSLEPNAALGRHIMDSDWLIPPMEEVVVPAEIKEIIFRQYGPEVMDRMAAYLCGIGKGIDVIRLPSNGGKTTLFDLLNACFPGAIAKDNATQVAAAGQRFTPMAISLTHKMAVFIDEATHDTAQLSASMLNSWDAWRLETEEKFLPKRLLTRIGSVCILASDEWPFIDASAQGAKNRFLWAMDRQEVGTMDSEERHILLQSESVASVRAWLLNRACQLLRQYGRVDLIRQAQEDTPDAQEGVAALFRERQHPTIRALKANFSYSHDHEEFVTVDSVKKVLKAEGIDKISNKALPQQVGKALDLPGKVESEKIYVEQKDGTKKQERVYRNVVKV